MMQFQMFLQQLIPAMEFGTALMTPLAVLLAILYSCDGGNLRKTFRKAAYWGFWGSVFIMAAKQGTRNAVSREGIEGLMAFFAIISELILAGVLLGSSEKFMKRLGIFKKGVIINVLALTMYYGMEIWLIPVTTVLNVNNPFSAEMLIRMLGFATGLFIFPILNTIGDIIAPNIPVNIIDTTVIASTPFSVFVKDIPIGVVIDFGINEFIISTSALVKCPINFIDIKDTTTPQLIPINISNKYFLNKSNCLYKGTANTIVTGPKKKFILSPPNL